MKNYLNLSTTVLQIFSLIALLLGPAFLFSGFSGNTMKGKDTKAIAQELNEKKFNDVEDKKNADFLVRAAAIHLQEIHLAQLAQQQGKQIDVKELGKMIEKINTSKFQSLTALAVDKSISIPTSATEKGLMAEEFLNKKSGLAFDREYCDMMVVSQKHAIKVFEEIAMESNDVDIKTWALTALPDLREHLEYARTCQKKYALVGHLNF